jgi:predicted nucleic acid-binding protein
MVHLDTSFLIRALVPGSAEDALLRDWLAEGEVLRMSAIAWAEFLCGPITTVDEEVAGQIVAGRSAFTEEQAAVAAHLFNETGRRRGSLGDCMIAAAALAERARVATANLADFQRLAGAGVAVVDSSRSRSR